MIITIQDSKASASIDSVGAQLISYQDPSGREYVWQRNPDYWANCSPLLFPIVGAVRNGRTAINGSWYEIPKHGFLKVSDFEVAAQGPDSVTFSLTDSEETRKVYPFPFRFEAIYSLKDGVLILDCCVENTGSSQMPYFIGTHPGFNCPLDDGESFEDYVLEFDQEEKSGYRSFDLKNLQFDMTRRTPFPGDGKKIALNYETFMNDAIWFDDLSSRKVELKNPSTGHGVAVSFPDYSTVAFWTPAETKAPFLCVEPWNGPAACSDEDDEFIHKNHLQTLEPGKTAHYLLKIQYL